jgi:hypothetical protein
VSVLIPSDPPLRARSVRERQFIARGMVSAVALVTITITTAGCAAAAAPAPSQDRAAPADSALALVSPDAAAACEGVRLDFAREYGPDAQLYSGRVTAESQLSAPPGAVETPSEQTEGTVTLCVYTDVPTSPPIPPRDDGIEVEYTVLGVKVNADGVAELHWMGPRGTEAD